MRDGKSPFVQLLEAVHAIEGLERIRFTSPHPKGYGDDLVEAYGRLGKLVESAHIPVQSGSDRVLKLMHRGYTRARFLSIIEKLRRVKPGHRPQHGSSSSAFPARRKRTLRKRYRWRARWGSTRAFVFKYSQRRDTPAADMPEPGEPGGKGRAQPAAARSRE